MFVSYKLKEAEKYKHNFVGKSADFDIIVPRESCASDLMRIRPIEICQALYFVGCNANTSGWFSTGDNFFLERW